MDLLLLLYSLSFVTISGGQYTTALNTAKDAALIQSGAKHQFEVVKGNANNYAKKKKILQPIIAVGWLYEAHKTKEITVRTKWGTLGVSNSRVSYGLSISF